MASPVFCLTNSSQHRQFYLDALLRFTAQPMKCNLKHKCTKRNLASLLCGINSIIVRGHPKQEPAGGDTASSLLSSWAQPSPAGPQPCCPHLLAPCLSWDGTLGPLASPSLYSNQLNLCGMWFHSAHLGSPVSQAHPGLIGIMKALPGQTLTRTQSRLGTERPMGSSSQSSGDP